jgi:high-affinity nickel permease
VFIRDNPRLINRSMGDQDDITELIFTLVIMAGLLVVCVVAVVIFFRIWRRENKGRGRNFFE